MSEQYFMAIHPIVVEIFIFLDQSDRMGVASRSASDRKVTGSNPSSELS